MNELSRLRGSERYEACADEMRKNGFRLPKKRKRFKQDGGRGQHFIELGLRQKETTLFLAVLTI